MRQGMASRDNTQVGFTCKHIQEEVIPQVLMGVQAAMEVRPDQLAEALS